MLLFALIGFDVRVGRWSAETDFIWEKCAVFIIYYVHNGEKSNVKQKAAECSIILLFE